MANSKAPKKKRRRRKRGTGVKRKRDLYFNQDTCDAIAEHQHASDPAVKERIFMSRIFPAFDKLVDNLINIHKFAAEHETHENLKNDCIVYLYETIHKFDVSRGTNAFSYFNIVAKHWLIVRSKKRVQHAKRNVSLDDRDPSHSNVSSLSPHDLKTIEEHSLAPPPDELIFSAEKRDAILALFREVRSELSTPNELIVIDAIISLFAMAQELDLLNKRAVLTYIREMTDLTPKQLTSTMHSIKRCFREIKCDDKFGLFEE